MTLTQTEISEPENPSVLRAKLSKSLSVKLCGVSPRCTCSDFLIPTSKINYSPHGKKIIAKYFLALTFYTKTTNHGRAHIL